MITGQLSLSSLVEGHTHPLTFRNSLAKPVDKPSTCNQQLCLSVIPLACTLPPAMQLLEVAQKLSPTDRTTSRLRSVQQCVYVLRCLWSDAWPTIVHAELFGMMRQEQLTNKFLSMYAHNPHAQLISALLSRGGFALDKMLAVLTELAGDASTDTNYLLQFATEMLLFCDDTAQEAIFNVVSDKLAAGINVSVERATPGLIKLWSEQPDDVRARILEENTAAALQTYEELSSDNSALNIHKFSDVELTALKAHCKTLQCTYTDASLLYLYVWNFEALVRLNQKAEPKKPSDQADG